MECMALGNEFQAEVARLALAAARDHGFALAGGNALAAHGIISRPTEDVDLFSASDGAVQAAAGLVAAALAAAGFGVAEVTSTSDLAEVIYGFEQDMTEFEVSRGGQLVRLQLVRFDRTRSPVMMDVGPVLHLDDLLGTKVSALATRSEPRDYLDVAAALRTYDRRQLLELARRADPDLVDEEFAEAMQRLDQLDDVVFRRLYRLTPAQIRDIRAAFSDWPR
jgi:Nucleotidyl transferase AbiEii toxin, Type IV TA system